MNPLLQQLASDMAVLQNAAQAKLSAVAQVQTTLTAYNAAVAAFNANPSQQNAAALTAAVSAYQQALAADRLATLTLLAAQAQVQADLQQIIAFTG